MANLMRDLKSALLATALLILLAGLALPVARAATVTVTNTNDNGPGSLRQAIASATAGDTITFNLSGCPCTIHLTSATLVIDKNLGIVGPGASQLAIDGSVASLQVLHLNSGLDVSLSGLTIQGGFTTLEGGGIHVADHSRLRLDDVNVTGNYTTDIGGGIYMGFTTGLIMTNSRVTGNHADAGGGGIYNFATIYLTNVVVSGNSTGGNGGGITNNNFIYLVNVAVLANTAGTGGGIINFGGPSSITNSVIDGNTATVFYGGGVHNNVGAWLTLTNVTISNNRSKTPTAGATNSGTLYLVNSTVAFNRLSPTAGISGLGNYGTMQLRNTIVANNEGGNCGAPVVSLGNNLDSGNTCAFTASGDLHDKDPLFNSLANAGTWSQGYPLLHGSPAIDAGNNVTCAAPIGSPAYGAGGMDQRGFVRPFDGDFDGTAICDIGAYEVGFSIRLPLLLR